MIENKDFREIKLPKDKIILTITDPPYNIGFKYGTHKDRMTDEEYIYMISQIPKPCVIIDYPEETLKYIIPAMKENPTKILHWCYNSHLPRATRWISFFGITPDLKKYKIPYRNQNDKRIKKLLENGSQGTAIKEWFIIEQVKNVSKEYQGYSNQIPEEIIRIILSVCKENFEEVFDPFCGSGTTLKVAKDMGYSFHGTDVDKKAIEITNKRLLQSTLKTEDDIPPNNKISVNINI